MAENNSLARVGVLQRTTRALGPDYERVCVCVCAIRARAACGRMELHNKCAALIGARYAGLPHLVRTGLCALSAIVLA